MTPNHNFIFCGRIESSGDAGRDGWLVKTDVNGNMIWQETFGGLENEGFNCMDITADGGYILCGYSGFDGWVVKVKSTACSIILFNPNGGEVWDEGSTHEISWFSQNTSGTVQIDYTTDGGGSWHSIANSTNDDRSYNWTLPQVFETKTYCYVRVVDKSEPSCYDRNDSRFTINDLNPCNITVTSPNGGEVWDESSVQAVTWTSQNTSGNVKIQFSNNGGVSWLTVENSTPDDGSFSWTLPSVSTDQTQCQIKIEDSVSSNCFDVSDVNFSIRDNSGLTIWPGDTNNDGITNQADVLPLGLFWGSSGPARSGASLQWIGQQAMPWTILAATYADANGDGIVNQADVLPIGFNWDKTHTLLASKAKKNNDSNINQTEIAALKINLAGSPGQYNSYRVEFFVENVTDLFGISFEMVYTPVENIDSVIVQYSSWLGENILYYSRENKSAGRVSFGISRKAGQGVISGSGVVALLLLKLTTFSACETIFFLQNITANDEQGNPIKFTALDKALTTIDDFFPSVTDSYVLYQNYPNPFNPETCIEYKIPVTSPVRIDVLNLKGQIIRILKNQEQSAGFHSVIWDGLNEQGKLVVSGVYMYQFRSGNFVEVRKMAFMK